MVSILGWLKSRENEAPGPQGSWLWGALADFRDCRISFFERIRKEHGEIVRYRLGPRSFVLICEPTVMKEVLVKRNRDFGRSFTTRMLRDFFGEGLLISEGKPWLKDRRIIQPTFQSSQIESYADVFVGQTVRFIDQWKADEERDALRDMQTLTMSIAAETLLGVRLADEVEAIHQPHESIRDYFDHRMENLLIAPSWIPTAFNRRVAQAKREIVAIVDRLIEERKASGELGDDILSRLLLVQQEDAGSMTDQRIRDQVLTFLFAGHETTASLLAWVWWLLAQHPQHEGKLHAELTAVLGDRPPTWNDIESLPYTQKVIRETLRLYPSAYVMGRSVHRDCKLGGFNIYRSDSLVFSPWLMQRDERFFDRPLEFNPDRWTDEFDRQLSQFAYFPFGVGPRKCIGEVFALMESVLIVATIASRFRLVAHGNDEIKPKASVTLRPSPGVSVKCQPRSK